MFHRLLPTPRTTPGTTRSLAACLAALTACATPDGGSARERGAPPHDPLPGIDLGADADLAGAEAIAALGEDLPAVARHYGMTADDLRTRLATSTSLRVSAWGLLYYAEEDPTGLAESTFSDGTVPTNPTETTIPEAETFRLHSKPDAVGTIWLDFEASTVTTPYWNGGRPIAVPAFSLDADPAYSSADLAAIRRTWLGVAEAYAPFNVDVTTERPASPNLTKFVRVIFSSNSEWYGRAGGVCYAGSFSWGIGVDSQTCWVFSTLLGNNTKQIADAGSHEAGHALGLAHWSNYDASGAYVSEYYWGYGTGTASWAPLMGGSYNATLAQWSKGEYPNAQQRQDDVSVIGGKVGYRPDDAAATSSGAPLLRGTAADGVATIDTRGVIGAASDADLHRLDTTGGAIALEVRPAAVGGNVDFAARLVTSNGTVLASADPAGKGTAVLQATLAAGSYYVEVRPVAYTDPTTGLGYSTYGSLGAYQIAGTYPGTNVASPVITPPPPPPAVDTIRPTAQITSPAAGFAVKNKTTFTITAAGADETALASIAIIAGNQTLCTVAVTTNQSVSCAYKPTKTGPVTLTARATDKAGNVGTSTPISITVTR